MKIKGNEVLRMSEKGFLAITFSQFDFGMKYKLYRKSVSMIFGWIDTNLAQPAFDEQICMLKVADFKTDYITRGYYNHREMCWYTVDGYCLNDNVYAWKTTKYEKLPNGEIR